MSDFIHLHNHTDYSMLDGAASISGYIAKCKETGMQAMAITDHGNMMGAVNFNEAFQTAGLKPIIGSEFYIYPPGRKLTNEQHRFHLILLAKNNKGYHNLLKLSSASYVEGFYYKPRIDYEILEKYHEGIICLSACLAGEIPQALLSHKKDEARKIAKHYKDLFGPDYYIEIQNHGIAEEIEVLPQLVSLAREMNIKLVATNDIHYLERSDANAHDILLCIGTGKKKSDENRLRFATDQFYFKTPEEMQELFSSYPDALSSTMEIAEKVEQNVIDMPGPKLPTYPNLEGHKDMADYLVYLANKGLVRRYGPDAVNNKTLTERLNYELGVVLKMHFEGYFLIVRDYIFWAKQNDIPVGPGRGSGAGSLVAYCIDITDVEPMKYGLIFERFLNPSRISMPDFDIDFCEVGRPRVIQHVSDLYGADHVSQIVAISTLRPKAVIKDVARVLDISFEEVNQITDLVPDEVDKHFTIEKAIAQNPALGEVEKRGGVYAELMQVSKRLQLLCRHTSLHAAGVVISQKLLDDYVPLFKDPKTGIIATQFTMDKLEDLGLVKMDFLGLSTLTLIKNTIDLIQKSHPDFTKDDIVDGDEATYKLFCDGETDCVFQFESPGMKKYLRRLQPSKLEEIVAMNALYRPGPMDFIESYIAGKLNPDKIQYPDPDLKELLEETYGVIVYQEQVMKVSQIIAGYTMAEADNLRKIMGKKKVDKLAEEKKKFIRKGVEMGRDEKHCEDLFTLLEPFGHYGFNKSHSVAYAWIAYETAFLKANYPTEFLAANLTNEYNNPDKLKQYLALAKAMDIEFAPPSVNDSELFFNVKNSKIVYGLIGIKGLGNASSEAIVSERNANGPYKDFMDFVTRLDSKAVGGKTIETLIQCGAFDGMGVNRATLMEQYPEAMKAAFEKKQEKLMGQVSLFGEDDLPSFCFRPRPEFDKRDILAKEKELTGFFLSGHPLDAAKAVYKRVVTVDTSRDNWAGDGDQVDFVGMVTAVSQLFTKKDHKPMGRITIEDYNTSFSATVFPKDWADWGSTVEVGKIYGFVIRFNLFNGELGGVIQKFFPDPSEMQATSHSKFNILVDLHKADRKLLSDIKATCMDFKGPLSVEIRIIDGYSKDNPEGGTAIRRIMAGNDCQVEESVFLLKQIQDNKAVIRAYFS
jgi:DNA polymerase-3 subunit alpha